MLAKDIKIQTILRQRAFIEQQLSQIGDIRNEDGDPAYPFKGHIYPENIAHFQEEGFDVTLVKSDMLTAVCKGLPLYIFTPKDDIVLSEEDMKKAEELHQQEQAENAQRKQGIHAVAEAAADELMARIFGGARPYADPSGEPGNSDEDDED